VDRTVELDVACIQAVLGAARAIGPDRLLTLNLSPRTLETKDFDAGWLLHGLYRNGISPGRVIIELTERDEITDLPRLRKTFQHLQQYGLRLAADDVGAGNAGLRLLSQVQFDIVKIDLSLVQDGVRRLGARAVLQSLRDLALSQQAHVVAEGVETREQLQVIRELEIGAGQGYLLGRPDASVEATFVDLGRIGSEGKLREAFGLPEAERPEAMASAADGPAAKLVLPGSADEHALPAGIAARPDLRSIVLPRGGLRARLEVETRGA
jgi:EAL domain-containing protein (putative c-di-GMP-specific phosphodiesterase class I)